MIHSSKDERKLLSAQCLYGIKIIGSSRGAEIHACLWEHNLKSLMRYTFPSLKDKKDQKYNT